MFVNVKKTVRNHFEQNFVDLFNAMDVDAERTMNPNHSSGICSWFSDAEACCGEEIRMKKSKLTIG